MMELILKLREKRRILMIHIGTQKGFLSERKDPPENKNQNHRHDRDDKRDQAGSPALLTVLFHLTAPLCMSFSGAMQTSISSYPQYERTGFRPSRRFILRLPKHEKLTENIIQHRHDHLHQQLRQLVIHAEQCHRHKHDQHIEQQCAHT